MKFTWTSSVILTVIFIVVPAHADYGNSPKCKQIETRIAKSRELVEFAKNNMRPDQAANAMINSKRRIAKYRQQYHDLGCDGSMPRAAQEQLQNRPPAQPGNMNSGGNATMSQPPDGKAVCIAQCKQYTSRTDEECFDTCWGK